VPGTLTFDGDEFVLWTRGSLDPVVELDDGTSVVHQGLRRLVTYPSIHGTLDDGVDVALLACTGYATAAPADIDWAEDWNPRVALLGVDHASAADAVFTPLTIELEDFAAWGGDADLEFEVLPGPGARVTVRRATLHRANLGDATVEVIADPRWRRAHREAEVSLKVVMKVTPREALAWEAAWERYVLPLRDLLAVLLGRAVTVHDVHLHRAEDRRHPAARMLIRTEDLRRRPRSPRDGADFVFTAASLPGGFEAGLRAWWAVREQRATAVREFVEVLHAPYAYVDDRLLAYCRAASALTTPETKADARTAAEVEDERWQAMVRERIPEDIRDAVMARLGDKDPNARHQLAALIRSLGDLGTWLTGGDVELYAQRVIATRNYLAHASRNTPRGFLEGRDRVAHMLALGWVIRARLLLEMGADPAAVQAASPCSRRAWPRSLPSLWAGPLRRR
jgi:hypothetical protein